MIDHAPADPLGAATAESSWWLGASAGAVPVVGVLVVDPFGWFPFTVAKWWAVLVVALIAVACCSMMGRWPRSTTGRFTDWSVMALVMVVVISAVGALDGLYSWTGTPVRHLGVMGWVLFGAMYVVGRCVGTDQDALDVMFRGVLVSAVGLAVYGLVELSFGPPIEFVGDSSRLGGTFGSAAYLGAGLCLIGPVVVGTAMSARTRLGRIGALALVGALVVVLAGSGSRSAVVGLAAAATLVLLFTPGRRRRRTMLAIVSGLTIVIVVGALRRTWERRFGGGSRLDEWAVAVRAINERPWLGVGPEGYRLVVGQFIDADYVRRYGEAVGIDRAHSGLLDVAVASGLGAAAAYVVVLAMLVWACVRLVRRGDARETSLATAVVAYGVQQQLLFPIAELDLSFWLLAGAVVTRSAGHVVVGVRSPGRWRVSAAVVVGALAVGAMVFGVRATAADRLARESLAAPSPDVAAARAQRATELAPDDLRLRLLLEETFERQRSLGGVDRALDAVADAARISPLDFGVRYSRAHLLGTRAAITGAAADRAAADDAWAEVLTDWPMCARCHVGAARAAIERGDISEARTQLEVAIALGSAEAGDLVVEMREE